MVGLVLIVLDLRNVVIIWNKQVKMMLVFVGLTAVSALLGLGRYPLKAILQDASMFVYGLFILVVFFLEGGFEALKQMLFTIYRWYPLVALLVFLLVSFVPFFQQLTVFGGIPLLLYKYGDMAVHLLIATLLMVTGVIPLSRNWKWVNACIIAFLFLVIASYNRAGMLAYLTGMVAFLLVFRKRFTTFTLLSYGAVLPLLIAPVLFIYLNTRVQENFQGRSLGAAQLQQNITSIFSEEGEGSLVDNRVWRLAWWYSIVSEATKPRNALLGRGIGENLALTSDIRVEDENLRSPHNFHLNVLARFGVIVFGCWIVWIWQHLRQLKDQGPNELNTLILIFFLAFIVNASFDVYLEGPMGALPFWSWLGILYLNDAKTVHAVR
ncbi:MAG: hypothetical protein FJX83_00045 [Bacteroidetes bacterium]|nr:hypothetical protein [Bacteroidota bacterium]